MDRTFGDNDRLAMDILSGSMYSLNFLRNISVATFDQGVEDMTVRDFHFLPEESINDAADEWGLSGAHYSSPKKPNPSIKHVVRRIRNALGHGNISINVPPDLDYRNDEFDFEKKSSIVFHDQDPRDKSDVFQIEVSIFGLIALVKKFYGVVYPEILRDTKAV